MLRFQLELLKALLCWHPVMNLATEGWWHRAVAKNGAAEPGCVVAVLRSCVYC